MFAKSVRLVFRTHLKQVLASKTSAEALVVSRRLFVFRIPVFEFRSGVSCYYLLKRILNEGKNGEYKDEAQRQPILRNWIFLRKFTQHRAT
jgi:hypothetical protein